MPRIKQILSIRLAVCVGIMVAMSGCTSLLSQQLLDSSSAPGSRQPAAGLATPPTDVFQVATSEGAPGAVEEGDLGPDVPTLTELSSRPVEGIDAPKVALSLEEDISTHKVSSVVRWRGKRSRDGVDVTNQSGTMCSGVSDNLSSKRVFRIACSDGRVGKLNLASGNLKSNLVFNNGAPEVVQFEE